MTVTDGITEITAVTGTYTWFSVDSSTGLNQCTHADSPGFDSAEMKYSLRVISTKPVDTDRRKGNEVALQFTGAKPDRVRVFCLNDKVRNTDSNAWEPVEVRPGFTVELLEGMHLYRTEADFGESYAEYGFIGAYYVPVIHVIGDGENPESGPDGEYGEENMDRLKEKYPEYFGLSVAKGLEVYVWQMAANSYSFGLLPGTNRSKTNEELWNLKGASASEMKAILSTYDIGEEDIFIIPFQQFFSSYIGEYWISEIGESESSIQSRREAYIKNIRDMLFED